MVREIRRSFTHLFVRPRHPTRVILVPVYHVRDARENRPRFEMITKELRAPGANRKAIVGTPGAVAGPALALAYADHARR